MARAEMTTRQRQILNYIKEQADRKGYPPSVREIGAAVGLSSSSTVHSHLNALERHGMIRRDPTKPRALEVLDRSGRKPISRGKNLPLVGQVAAGSPLLAEENIEDYLTVPDELASSGSFLLTVKGDSMIDAGIFDGDIIVVRQQQTADNSDIVVALMDDEATVKRFYKESDRIRLQPENSAMAPIYTKNVTILGKVTGLMRRI